MTIDSQNKLYIALVVTGLYNQTSPDKTIYREDFILHKAKNIEEAKSMIALLAKGEEVIYKSVEGEVIRVEFIRIQDIAEAGEDLCLYSRHFNDLSAYDLLNTLD